MDIFSLFYPSKITKRPDMILKGNFRIVWKLKVKKI